MSKLEAQRFLTKAYYDKFRREYARQANGNSMLEHMSRHCFKKNRVLTEDDQQIQDLVKACLMPVVPETNDVVEAND
jgi:hypothetical protein